MYELWLRILNEAKNTVKYNPKLNYGIFQINDELDTYHTVPTKRGKDKKVWDYIQLHSDLNTMRGLVKTYYHTHIMSNLFKYSFIK